MFDIFVLLDKKNWLPPSGKKKAKESLKFELRKNSHLNLDEIFTQTKLRYILEYVKNSGGCYSYLPRNGIYSCLI